MQPETNGLIQQLTRPLEANAELHLAARSYLLERLNDPRGRVCENAGEWESHGGAQAPRAVTSAATQSPDILPTTTPPKPWRRWFYLAVAALIVALSSSLVLEVL